ncbi:MAG TPA: GntR family transcriptional regulator [Chloroflexota bacterium]|nr:GntR family transcriptional regulator [Chloroflexota bacterium]
MSNPQQVTNSDGNSDRSSPSAAAASALVLPRVQDWRGAGRRPGVAAYVQIEAEIEEKIRSGEIPPGALIPPERELAEQMGVSRMTVRQALGRLVDRGLIVRQQGRGSFASEPKLTQNMSRLQGFFDQMVSQGVVPTSRLLSTEEIMAGRAVAQALGLQIGEPVFKIARLRLGNAQPLALETSFFPARLVPGLIQRDLESTSIYHLMAEYGARPVRAIQSLEPVQVRREEAEILRIREASPVMLVERTAWDEHGRAVEYAKDIYRGDRSRFVAELTL